MSNLQMKRDEDSSVFRREKEDTHVAVRAEIVAKTVSTLCRLPISG